MKLTILRPVRHDGKRLAPGDVVDIRDEAQARALLDCGAAQVVAASKRKAESSPVDLVDAGQ